MNYNLYLILTLSWVGFVLAAQSVNPYGPFQYDSKPQTGGRTGGGGGHQNGTINRPPVAFLKVGQYNIPIFSMNSSKSSGVPELFIPPMLAFVPGSARMTTNPFTGSYQICFQIQFVNTALEKSASRLMTEKLGRVVHVTTIRISNFRLSNITQLSPHFQLDRSWVKNNRFQDNIGFSMSCSGDGNCQNLSSKINGNPELMSINFAMETTGGKEQPGFGELDKGTKWRIYSRPLVQEIENASIAITNAGGKILLGRPGPTPSPPRPSSFCQALSLPTKNGWCIIQKHRRNWKLPNQSDQSMNKSWSEYNHGFGSVSNRSFWGGLERIRKLSTFWGHRKLKIEWYDLRKGYMDEVVYGGFQLGPESDRYRLYLGKQISGWENIFYRQCGNKNTTGLQPVGQQFATYDRDIFCISSNTTAGDDESVCRPARPGEIGVAARMALGWWIGGLYHTTAPNFQHNTISYCDHDFGRQAHIQPRWIQMLVS